LSKSFLLTCDTAVPDFPEGPSRRQRRVAGLRPNPSIVAETENVAGTGLYRGVRASETTVGLALPQRVWVQLRAMAATVAAPGCCRCGVPVAPVVPAVPARRV
jgi:hypothetical protein